MNNYNQDNFYSCNAQENGITNNSCDNQCCNSKCEGFTTGVLSRNVLTDFIRITWVNLGDDPECHRYQIFDWSDGTPVLLKSDVVQLDPMESKVIDFTIFSSGYGDILDVEFYEVRIFNFCRSNTIANIFGISNAGIINEGNTVLFSQLISINGSASDCSC